MKKSESIFKKVIEKEKKTDNKSKIIKILKNISLKEKGEKYE